MAEHAVFQGIIVDGPKNYGTHKEVVVKVHVPAEFGAAIVAAFGWPTRVNPVHVAVARLEGVADLPKPASRPEPRAFDDLSPSQQAGILCKDPEFTEFLRTTAPYKNVEPFFAYTTADQVRHICGVQSRADIKEGTEAENMWRKLVAVYRHWQDERSRLDVGF